MDVQFAENTAVDDNRVEVYVPTPGIDMFLIHRHMRSGGRTCMADIVQLDTVLQVVDLVSKHGQHTDPALNCNNSLEGNSFYLNNFANKGNFHAILSYQ